MMLPKTRCPACGRTVALRTHGQLREHRATPGGELCWASGWTPGTVRLRLEAKARRSS